MQNCCGWNPIPIRGCLLTGRLRRKLATELSLLLLASVTSVCQVHLGFDFRNTASFITDPSGNTAVLPSTAYPTTVNGITFGWANPHVVLGRDRSTTGDPRLAGINFVRNGRLATFYIDLPAPGTYNVSLAMGDASSPQCWRRCEIQFLDGNTVLATIASGLTEAGFFFDMAGNNWSKPVWPTSNVSVPLNLKGSRLKVVVGTRQTTGDATPIAFLGISDGTTPGFHFLPSLTVARGQQGSATLTFTANSGFDSPITLSAGGVPPGVTVTLNPTAIPAPGSGSSTMTVSVAPGAVLGTFPIAVTGIGGGMNAAVFVALTVR